MLTNQEIYAQCSLMVFSLKCVELESKSNSKSIATVSSIPIDYRILVFLLY